MQVLVRNTTQNPSFIKTPQAQFSNPTIVFIAIKMVINTERLTRGLGDVRITYPKKLPANPGKNTTQIEVLTQTHLQSSTIRQIKEKLLCLEILLSKETLVGITTYSHS